MQVLVVGGTRFIGRHTVNALLAAGHDVTLLNRGQTAPDVFADVPQIHADRHSDALQQTSGRCRDWDAVVDLSAYHPIDVQGLLDTLDDRIGRYVFCSTISAYAPTPAETDLVTTDEAPLWAYPAAILHDRNVGTYPECKSACETLMRQRRSVGLSAVILRPSLVYGPWDDTDRLAYWIVRAASQQPFILPEAGLSAEAEQGLLASLHP